MGLKKRGFGKGFLIIGTIVFLIAIAAIFFFVLNPTSNKADPVSEQCSFACQSNQKTAFCDVQRKIDSKNSASCNELATNSQYANLNVQACPTISCVTVAQPDQTCVTGLNSEWATPTTDGSCPAQEGKFVRKRTASDQPPIDGQICCYYYS